MPITDQTLDAINSGELSRVGTQALFVDAIVLFERAQRGGKDATPGMFKHLLSFPCQGKKGRARQAGEWLVYLDTTVRRVSG